MNEPLKATIRLKKQEAIDLKEMAFELTKKAIMNGKQKIHTESDIVHLAIEYALKNIGIDDNGELILGAENKKK